MPSFQCPRCASPIFADAKIGDELTCAMCLRLIVLGTKVTNRRNDSKTRPPRTHGDGALGIYLFLFNFVALYGFIYGAAWYWQANPLAAYVCISGAGSIVLLLLAQTVVAILKARR